MARTCSLERYVISVIRVNACKKENIPTFDAAPSIYFIATSHLSPKTVTDSTLATFGYAADNVTDTVVSLLVNVLGKTASVDRVYKVVVLDSRTTAKAGFNYDLPQNPVIRAGFSTDSLNITIHRTPDILYNPLTLVLQLEPNENFKTDMTMDSLDAISGKPVYYTIFRVIMQDGLTKPWLWSQASYYFGTFSPKKLKLIHTVTGMPLDALSSYDYYANWTFWATMTNRYLLDQKAAGTPVLEDDGTPMTMGRIVTM